MYMLNDRLCDLNPTYLPLHTYKKVEKNLIKNLIKGKKCKLKCMSFSVVCKGPQMWNELDNIKISLSV